MNNYNKTDRRGWNKSNQELNLDYPDESQKRYDDYLFNLHLNNQLVKVANKKDKHEEEMARLESGFNLYVNGAHKKQERYTPRHTTATRRPHSSLTTTTSTSSSKKFSTKLNLDLLTESMRRSPSTASSTSRTPLTTNRKKWANSSFIFKTCDGYEIKINSPNHYNGVRGGGGGGGGETSKASNQSNECDYSDDFESDEEDEEKTQNKKDLIENVKFSDQEDDQDSSDSDNDNHRKEKKNRYVFKLSKNDVKLLRESFIELNDSIRSDDSLHKKEIDTPPEEIDSDPESTNTTCTGNHKNTACSKTKSKPSEICNLILEKAVFLKRKDRENLVEFLSKIDEQQVNNNK